jgi:hypothetical protein
MVTLAVKTDTLSGKFRKTATVFSNDPLAKNVELVINGIVKPYIFVEPRSFIYLLSTKDKNAREIIRLRANEGEKFKILGADNPLTDKISYEIKEIHPGSEYEVIVENKSREVGRYTGNLNIKTDHPKRSLIPVRVSGEVRGEVLISPPYVVFGNISLEKLPPAAALKRRVWIRRENGKELKLTEVKVDETRYQVDFAEQKKGTDYAITVTLKLQGLAKGSYRDELLIRTDVESQPVLKIPIIVSIK